MGYIYLLLFIIGCTNNSSKNVIETELNPADNKEYLLEERSDSLQDVAKEKIALFSNKTLTIYPFYRNYEKEEYGFIPLTETYSWSEHPDSLMIDNKYLGKQKTPDDYKVINYHLLSDKKRQQFLLRSNINENDKVFIYNLELDSLEIHEVSQINLCAFIPYGYNGLARQYDYQVGFEMVNSSIFGSRTGDCLVYVGKENPFILHSIQSMKWTAIDSTHFPINKSNVDEAKLKRCKRSLGTYKFEQDQFLYYLQELGDKNIYARHIVIINKETEKMERCLFVLNSDGSFITPLNGAVDDYKNKTFQWAGKLFKNKPPVIFGFIGMSFGCPKIHYVNEEYDYSTDLHLKCDNRH